MSVRVLLVDDHKIFREGLRSMLEKQPDIEVVGEAENGLEACTMAGELLPDVIIMDIVMPDMNGIEATRQIAARILKVRIIGLSMHSDVRYATEMLRAGASGFLLKDSAFEELVNAVNAVNAGHIYLNPGIMESMIRNYISLLSAENHTSASILTSREQEVLRLLAEGNSTRDIASLLKLSIKTVETHRQNIMEKLGIHSMAELVKYAIREGLTSL